MCVMLYSLFIGSFSTGFLKQEVADESIGHLLATKLESRYRRIYEFLILFNMNSLGYGTRKVEKNSHHRRDSIDG